MDWMQLLEPIAELAKVFNPPSYAPGIAGSLNEQNPYRQKFQQMTGDPTLNAIEAASNWEMNNRQQNFQQAQFDANTANVTPEYLKQFSPDNFLAQMMQPGRRYLNDLTPISQQELALKERQRQQGIQGQLMEKLAPLSGQVQTTPQGTALWNLLSTPGALPQEKFIEGYGQTGGLAQAKQNQQMQGATLNQMVGQMPAGGLKQMLGAMVPLAKQPGMEGLFSQIAGGALGSNPSPLTPKDQAELELLKAQTYHYYNPTQGSGKSSANQMNSLNLKQEKSFMDGLEKEYALELKRNTSKKTTNLDGTEKWVYPDGAKTPDLNTWIKQRYGDETLRRYLASKTGNQTYTDTKRTTFGVQHFNQSQADVMADQYVATKKLGSISKTVEQAIIDRQQGEVVDALIRRAVLNGWSSDPRYWQDRVRKRLGKK